MAALLHLNEVRQLANVQDVDSFYMFVFKMLPCDKVEPHNWQCCPFAHAGEKARRRDFRSHRYSAQKCPDAGSTRGCPRGDTCFMSHHVFETWLHPERYRTQLCTEGHQCHRSSCWFAHSVTELRLPSEIPAALPTRKPPTPPPPPPPLPLPAAAYAGGGGAIGMAPAARSSSTGGYSALGGSSGGVGGAGSGVSLLLPGRMHSARQQLGTGSSSGSSSNASSSSKLSAPISSSLGTLDSSTGSIRLPAAAADGWSNSTALLLQRAEQQQQQQQQPLLLSIPLQQQQGQQQQVLSMPVQQQQQVLSMPVQQQQEVLVLSVPVEQQQRQHQHQHQHQQQQQLQGLVMGIRQQQQQQQQQLWHQQLRLPRDAALVELQGLSLQPQLQLTQTPQQLLQPQLQPQLVLQAQSQQQPRVSVLLQQQQQQSLSWPLPPGVDLYQAGTQNTAVYQDLNPGPPVLLTAVSSPAPSQYTLQALGTAAGPGAGAYRSAFSGTVLQQGLAPPPPAAAAAGGGGNAFRQRSVSWGVGDAAAAGLSAMQRTAHPDLLLDLTASPLTVAAAAAGGRGGAVLPQQLLLPPALTAAAAAAAGAEASSSSPFAPLQQQLLLQQLLQEQQQQQQWQNPGLQ